MIFLSCHGCFWVGIEWRHRFTVDMKSGRGTLDVFVCWPFRLSILAIYFICSGGKSMADLKGSKTENNLKEAFAGESQANRKYLAFAQKADKEGFTQVAKLFRAAAEAETVHAHAHLRVLGGISSTEENLTEAINGETHEFTAMYPEMIKDAEAEGFNAALKSFTLANTVEKVHAALYRKALETLGKSEAVDYYVCQACGHTVEGEPDGPCEVCGAAKSAFKKTD
jgi:rubrerythrin